MAVVTPFYNVRGLLAPGYYVLSSGSLLRIVRQTEDAAVSLAEEYRDHIYFVVEEEPALAPGYYCLLNSGPVPIHPQKEYCVVELATHYADDYIYFVVEEEEPELDFEDGYDKGFMDGQAAMASKDLSVTAAGDELAAAAARVCAEYDGVHRLRAALSKWFDVRAGVHGSKGNS